MQKKQQTKLGTDRILCIVVVLHQYRVSLLTGSLCWFWLFRLFRFWMTSGAGSFTALATGLRRKGNQPAVCLKGERKKKKRSKRLMSGLLFTCFTLLLFFIILILYCLSCYCICKGHWVAHVHEMRYINKMALPSARRKWQLMKAYSLRPNYLNTFPNF